MSLFTLENLSISFRTSEGSFDAVKRMSFSLNEGESIAIVGESGSGKSVSMRAVMGLLDPRSIAKMEGSARFQLGEKSIDLLSDASSLQHIRGKEIGMIFQEPMTALNPVMRCGKQIMEVVETHLSLNKPGRKAHVQQLLEEVQLTDIPRMLKSYPHELSGGQRQRIMIAMALAANPKLLIADEPTTALDVSVQAAILKLIRRLQKERNMALIFISHDLGVVKEIADRTLVMFRGEQLETGESGSLFANPQHIYTKALIKCRPSAHKANELLPVMSDFFELDADGTFIEKPSKEPTQLSILEKKKEVLIEVTGLDITYNRLGLWGPTGEKNHVIQGLDLQVFKGETLGVLGESGSGKSTTGRAIMQLIRYVGEVKMNGEILHPAKARDRKVLAKKIQMIYQDPYSSLNPKYRIGDSFMEVMECHTIGINKADRKERGKASLEKVGLSPDAWNKYPHEFSGGQRQRIAIARALLVEPEFIVCDEAVSALDVSVQAQILNLLKSLQREMGLSYLFITHDLQVVRNISDRVLVLNKGKIAELKETEALFAHPEDEYTQGLLASYSSLD